MIIGDDLQIALPFHIYFIEFYHGLFFKTKKLRIVSKSERKQCAGDEDKCCLRILLHFSVFGAKVNDYTNVLGTRNIFKT